MRWIFVGLLAASGPAFAQQAVSATPPPAASCEAAEFHQLDFWVGRWDGYPTGKDTLVAHSLIEKVYGCGIRENWMPIGKPGGGSLSIYVPGGKHWEQFWINFERNCAFLPGAGTARRW